MLAVSNLNAGYGSTQVLFDVSVPAAPGQCVAILGPNGSGKTTLLRAISGFIKALPVSITLDGANMGSLPPHKVVELGVSHVMQGRQVLGPMTVRDNLLLGAHVCYGRGDGNVDKSLEEIYQLFPILEQRQG